MKNKIMIVLLCVLSLGLGFAVGKKMVIKETENIVAVSDTVQKITPSTKMVYEYYYPEDDVTEVYEDVPPYFLIDYTLDDIKRCYSNWNILSFSDREVIMKKVVSGPSRQRYIIGESDGFITVFYDFGEDGIIIKEVTDVLISSLSEEEAGLIKEGIAIVGNDKLNRALEDLTS